MPFELSLEQLDSLNEVRSGLGRGWLGVDDFSSMTFYTRLHVNIKPVSTSYVKSERGPFLFRRAGVAVLQSRRLHPAYTRRAGNTTQSNCHPISW